MTHSLLRYRLRSLLLLVTAVSVALALYVANARRLIEERKQEAQQLIAAAELACERALLDEGKKLFESGLDRWRTVLDGLAKYGSPGERRNARVDALRGMKQYQELLRQLDEELPDDSPLQDLVQNDLAGGP